MEVKIITGVVVFCNSIIWIMSTALIGLLAMALTVSPNDQLFDDFLESNSNEDLKLIGDYIRKENIICKTFMDFGLILLYGQDNNYLQLVMIFGLFSLCFNLYYSPQKIRKALSKDFKKRFIFIFLSFISLIANLFSIIILILKTF